MKKLKIFLLAFLLMLPAHGSALVIEPVKYYYVISGNSIVVDYRGKKTVVRLINVNPFNRLLSKQSAKDPRKVRANKAINKELGIESAKYLHQMLEGYKFLIVETDKVKYDKRGRLLAYVWTDFENMVNLRMIQRGYARVRPATSNIRYRKIFLEEEELARDKNKGLWDSKAY